MAGVSRADELITDPDKYPALGGIGVFRYTRLFTDHLGGFFDLSWAQYPGGDEWPQTKVPEARIGAEWLFSPGAKWRWSFTLGGGWMSVRPKDVESFDRGFVSAAIGQRRTPEGRVAFRWEIRGDQTVTDDGLDGESITLYHALIGLGWGFGGPPKDTDEDGVIDRKDKCPDTPRGATVDAQGCPQDADGDGVYDGLDRCPDTPKGVRVDAAGCPLDTDGDGVPDHLDKCPGTPRGVKVDATGCPLDTDGDGVPDHLDKCPGTPRGVKVDATGCPLDTDGDGVPDHLDRCPDTPRGTKVDANGCPVRVTEPIFKEGKKSLVLEGVTFEYDSAKLTAESTAVLDKVAASLVEWSDVNVEVNGHTDSKGADAYNMKLSQARAEAVRDYLVSKGVASSRLAAKGFGETKPIADNKTDEGRAQNRRVELTQTN